MQEARPLAGAALVLLASLIALAWYGQGQLIYSLAFLYQVAQTVFPGLPVVRGGP
jgi:hypothetical protein